MRFIFDLLNKIQEFKIAKASTVGNAYVVDVADIDEDFIKPKKSMILALGALFGSMLGLLTVFLRKALHHFVDNPEKLEKETGIPVYATIPLSTQVKLTNSITEKNRKQKALLAQQDKHDPAIESLRSLRTSLHFALHEAKNNVCDDNRAITKYWKVIHIIKLCRCSIIDRAARDFGKMQICAKGIYMS